ncbi:MAG: hypothetical protein WC614_08960 [bacterium]
MRKTFILFYLILFSFSASAQVDSSDKNISFSKDKEILKLGRQWIYRIFFINPEGDTTDSPTISLDIVKGAPSLFQDNKEHLLAKWTYLQKNILPDNAHKLESICEIDEDSNRMVFSTPCYVELNFMMIFGQAPVELGTFLEKGQKTEFVYVNIYADRYGGEATCRIKTYSRITARKDVRTPMKVFPGCLEIDAKATSEKGTYKATYYFQHQYGIVRFEYTKLDSSRVIFDLEKVSGF